MSLRTILMSLTSFLMSNRSCFRVLTSLAKSGVTSIQASLLEDSPAEISSGRRQRSLLSSPKQSTSILTVYCHSRDCENCSKTAGNVKLMHTQAEPSCNLNMPPIAPEEDGHHCKNCCPFVRSPACGVIHHDGRRYVVDVIAVSIFRSALRLRCMTSERMLPGGFACQGVFAPSTRSHMMPEVA